MKARPNILTVLGTDCDALRMVSVLREFHAAPELESRIVVSDELGSEACTWLQSYGIDVDGTPEAALVQAPPDLMLIAGDSQQGQAAALTAFRQRIPIAQLAFDTEQNDPSAHRRRAMIGALAEWRFVARPTPASSEGDPLPRRAIRFVSGDPLVDSLSALGRGVPATLPCDWPVETDRAGRILVLDTGCSQLEVSEARRLADALKGVLSIHADLHLALVSRTDRPRAFELEASLSHRPRVHDFSTSSAAGLATALSRAYLVVTGSTLSELFAYSFRIPSLSYTVRFNRLMHYLEDRSAYLARADQPCPYGDGHAAVRMVAVLKSHFDLAPRPDEWLPPGTPSAASPKRGRLVGAEL